jgi:hypothetical protein
MYAVRWNLLLIGDRSGLRPYSLFYLLISPRSFLFFVCTFICTHVRVYVYVLEAVYYQ